ncbi:Phosphatidylinositol 4-kinase pik1alpha (PI4-kinase)(PtdIns-4-kinase) [Thoreauomyces humboldtii]|nr:Phosphatidylinositol 4-kinase pik1alpha (PI4-kinase)(PtdIns-4-kinase) [Thoreauomyces humboldtii]
MPSSPSPGRSPNQSRARAFSSGPTQLANSWLLRLFNSEFFDSRLAVSYLNRYPDSIGIQHYICDRLDEFPNDLEFLLPQLCHLLISRHTESVALENFILRKCKTNHHAALLTLWFLQAHLSDMRGAANVNTESYSSCQRLYHKCQAIVFADTPNTHNAGAGAPSWRDLFHRTKMRENVRPAVVGIGAILAAGVCSLVVDESSQMVLAQGCRWKSLAADPAEDTEPASLAARRSESVKDARELDKGIGVRTGLRRHSTDAMSSSRSRGLSVLARIPTGAPTPDELSRGGAFSFQRYVTKTARPTSTSALNADGPPSPAAPTSPAPATLLTPDQRHLETSHYFHSEIQFMMTLVDISDRLRSVPKEARQSTLIAELALLNHNLPANVCLPAWCNASSSHPGHHRVARISPSDAVVLNSADRVPFLITIEILEDVPTPKSRRSSMAPVESQPSGSLLDSGAFQRSTEDDIEEEPSPDSVVARQSIDQTSTDYHLNVLTRRKSIASFTSRNSYDGNSPVTPSPRVLTPIVRLDPSNEDAPPPDHSVPVVDEFSERLRTAAVMLAQLYQQQQRELSVNAGGGLADAGTRVVVGAGGLPSSTRGVLAQGGVGTQAPGSPMLTTKDRRNQQKLQADFESIKNRLIKEMVTLEEKRVRKLALRLQKSASDSGEEGAADEVLPETEEDLRARCQDRDKDDPSAAVFKETWDTKMERIRASSPYGRESNWRLLSIIVKSGADLRQEQLALQLIREMQRIWRVAGVPVWVCYFRILITSDQSGIMETIRDAISVHSIKKEGYAKQQNEKGLPFTLYDYFVREFGQPGSTRFGQAQDNFMRSLAAYSVICYLLQIKDRHNGNILIDVQGHVIHIDFGFMLSNSPGGGFGFELAPFKFPQEYVDILGGMQSEKFAELRALMKECFLALRKKAEDVIGMVEMMEHGSRLPCFTGVSTKPSSAPVATGDGDASSFMSFLGEHGEGGSAGSVGDAASSGGVGTANGTGAVASGGSGTVPATASSSTAGAAAARHHPVAAALRDRFHLTLNESQVGDVVDSLVDRSCGSAYTRMYDSFQYYANGIL